jgi:O-succinylbenzoic acid--CoA ligase
LPDKEGKMFIIDFGVSKQDTLTSISNRDYPSWTVPVFDFIRSWLDDSVHSFAVQTSGSTGTPKLIQHSRESMTASAMATCDFFQLKKNDTALLTLPATHIGGKMMIVRSIIRGMQLICVEPRSNPLEYFSYDGEIEFAAFTPMQMSMILEDKAIGTDRDLSLQKINKIILGGGEVPYPLKQKLQSISLSVYETYGMTETVSHIALKKINGTERSDYFTILDGVKISTDARDCLVIDAPHLSTQTLVTNDIVSIISPNEFIWLSRYDNVINTGGIKIYAEEVERKLEPYIKDNFFITGLADDKLGQRVSMVIETPRYDKQDDSIMIDIFNSHLEKFERPRKVLNIEKFSYTENGKINKKETLNRITPK